MPRGGQRLRDKQGRSNGIGERVRERRCVLGLTQPQLCARIETITDGEWLVDRQDILRIENGSRIVGDLEIRCLAHVLEITACWLLRGDIEEVPKKWL